MRPLVRALLWTFIALLLLSASQLIWAPQYIEDLPRVSKKLNIAIMTVVERHTSLWYYEIALKSVSCYAKAHGYTHIVLNDSRFDHLCASFDGYFRRHCIVSENLSRFDYVLFLDADIGVVNPKRRIEEFIADPFEIIFYDRFYNSEVMAGSYLVKNTEWARKFLRGFSSYEFRLPYSFHGTDNGAIHAYLAEVIFPKRTAERNICQAIYNRSTNFDDLFAFEACIRSILGSGTDFGKIRIMTKGTGWARDTWLTNSKWSPERDFMIHEWKMDQLQEYTAVPVPIHSDSRNSWYDPFYGEIDTKRCGIGNTSWDYDANLMASKSEIDEHLAILYEQFHGDRINSLARAAAMMQSVQNENQ